MGSHGTTILVIDDDALLCATLTEVLARDGATVLDAQTAARGLELCAEEELDVVLLDQQLPDGQGVDLCPRILELNDQAKIVFMTGYPTFENAVAALRAGAYDYLSKPFEIGELQLTVSNALRTLELERIEQLHSRRRRQEVDGTILVGADGGLEETARLAELAGASTAAVLISGETGTGKTLLARHIHYSGPRREGPFVSLNCAALPESLAESELFGHEKGAFTGAAGRRRGVFEMAEGGTAFLDEIGAMPVHLQAKLLGVLEDRCVRRLGGETIHRVDARVVAATNTDLDEAVRTGAFRQDLYYRLSVMRIHLPPLRDRRQDIPELCAHLVRTIHGQEVEIDAEQLRRLAAYDWPGNVRELRNILERSLIVHPSGRLAPADLIASPGAAPVASVPTAAGDEGPIVPLEQIEREHIERALAHFEGNLTRTAKGLGIALSTLKRKLQRYRPESDSNRATGPD
jgi:DNA-binding NtrC family response regulator